MSSFVPRALEKDPSLLTYTPRAEIRATRPLVSVQNCFQCITTTSATSALEATKLILARAESLEASREDAPDDAKKAASLDGLN